MFLVNRILCRYKNFRRSYCGDCRCCSCCHNIDYSRRCYFKEKKEKERNWTSKSKWVYLCFEHLILSWIFSQTFFFVLNEAESIQFDLSTIEAATNNFSERNKLGEGGFGEVYKVYTHIDSLCPSSFVLLLRLRDVICCLICNYFERVCSWMVLKLRWRDCLKHQDKVK